MKKNLLKVLGLCLTLAAPAVLATRSHAVNLGDAQLAQVDETANSGYVLGGANIGKAVNLFFTGKTQTGTLAASTGAYVTISATAMTFYQPFGTVDATVGTAGVVTYASTLASNTMGALCDYLTSLGSSYVCRLQGAQRNDPPIILNTQTSTNGTNNLAAAGGFSVLQTTTTFISLGITPAANRRVVMKQCVSNGNMGAGDSGLQLYGQLRKFDAVASPSAVDQYGVAANDSYSVWTSSQVTNTTTYQPSQYAIPRWIEFATGAHVVAREGNVGGASVQAASNFLYCLWDER